MLIFLVVVLLHLKTIIQLLSTVVTLRKKPPVSILIIVDKYISNVFFISCFTLWFSQARLLHHFDMCTNLIQGLFVDLPYTSHLH